MQILTFKEGQERERAGRRTLRSEDRSEDTQTQVLLLPCVN